MSETQKYEDAVAALTRLQNATRLISVHLPADVYRDYCELLDAFVLARKDNIMNPESRKELDSIINALSDYQSELSDTRYSLERLEDKMRALVTKLEDCLEEMEDEEKESN